MKPFSYVISALNENPAMLSLFNKIRKTGPIQKSRVGLTLPVSKPTLYLLMQKMHDLGLISEEVTSENGKHRRSTVVTIKKGCYYSLGVDIHTEGIRILLMDIDQTVVFQKFLPNLINLQKGVSKDNRFIIIERLQKRIPLLLEEARIQQEQIIAIGISDASFIDSKDSISVFNRYIPKWEDVPIGSILSRLIPVQTFLERDAAVTALAETQLIKPNKITNALCISLRHGISLGILINKQVFTGQTGNAGEWSVMNLFRDSKHTGEYLDLDTLLGISTLREIFDKRIFSDKKAAKANSMADEVIIKKLFSAYENGSEEIKSDIDKYIKLMAVHMANLIYIFDMEFIIIAGHFTYCGEKFRINLEKQTRSHLRKFRKITIIIGRLGVDAAVLGAALMAQEKMLNS